MPVANGHVVAVHHGVEVGAAVVGIVFQKVEVGFRVKEIVDGDDLHRILILGMQGPENLPPDAAEAVDADFNFFHIRTFSPRRPDSCRM